MIVLGMSEGYHDAGLCIIEDNKILHASQSERYSGIKNDFKLHHLQFPKSERYQPDVTAFYEKPFRKNLRRLYAGQSWQKPSRKCDHYFGHHESHAAAGYYTSSFDDCNILVIDAIGEWDTISIWEATTEKKHLGHVTHKLKKIKSWKYPYSLGLLYSAITQYIGFKPNEEEYITMGMAAFGEPIHDLEFLLFENNHTGVNLNFKARREDLAASVQALYEKELLKLVEMCPHENLVLMGGCALNCVANSKIKGKNIWIMPAASDAGSSLGAAALVRKRKLTWDGPYLGHLILGRPNVNDIVSKLIDGEIVGVAHGKAEFGPRALGNRSLLADPRDNSMKDKVNEIKRRQKFRPFAPAILEEYADLFFEGPMNEYMQFVAKAKHDYSSVTHIDGTARVQVVRKNCGSIIRDILEEWYECTGCPMLLNTSLNIRGKPMVNTVDDAKEFEKKYNVQVF